MTAYESALLGGPGPSNYAPSIYKPLKNPYRLLTNAGITKESYFRSNQAPTGGFNTGAGPGNVQNGRSGLWRILQTDSAGNTPAAVQQASVLWSNSQPYKGMITTSTHKENEPSTDDKTAAKTNPLAVSYRADGMNYGFQFHYNPGSLNMSYAGPPPVDVTLMTSGREKFNTYGPTSGSGHISMNLILNRINDMKYFDPRTGRLKAGVSPNVFSGRAPTTEELADIYNRGTMYDMEFLFRTILGYEIESALGRGMSWDKKTADVGWLGGKPVEIHLGKSLRYLGRVIDVNITHVLFTERMVPTFSEVGITIQRLPDITRSQASTTNQSRTPTTPRVTYRNGMAYNTYTDDLGRTVSNPIFDGTFG